MLSRCKANSRRRQLECSITVADLRALAERAKGLCQVSGIPFNDRNEGQWQMRPWIASVDRIENSKGYTVGNCRLVCNAVNNALGQWGDDVFMRIVAAMSIEIERRREGDEALAVCHGKLLIKQERCLKLQRRIRRLEETLAVVSDAGQNIIALSTDNLAPENQEQVKK